VAGSLIVNQVAAAARSAGTLNEFIGESFVVDAVAKIDIEPTGIAAISPFLKQVTSVIRKYLSAVHSVPELAGLTQLIMLILAAAMVYYAEQSPSAGDIRAPRKIAALASLCESD
jgi:hypothetical protein